MRRRDFRLLVGAIFLSALGDWLALTALALHLEETTGSGLALSALFVALWAPLVVFAGHAGLLADRLEAKRRSPVGRAWDGIVFLTRDRTLWLVMLVAFASLLFMTASAPAEVFFAMDVLEVGDAGFGALWTAGFAGMAIGGLVLSRRVPGTALVAGALAAIVAQSLGLALPALWLSLAFA